MRIKHVIVGALLFVSGCIAAQVPKQSAIYRAWQAQEKVDSSNGEEQSEINRIGRSFVMSERWKNHLDDLKHCPTFGEITEASISKTYDSGEWVVTLYGIDAHQGENPDKDNGFCSLWMDGSGQDANVRTITPY